MNGSLYFFSKEGLLTCPFVGGLHELIKYDFEDILWARTSLQNVLELTRG